MSQEEVDAHSKLQNVHDLLCDRALKILNDPEATVQELETVRKFRKDNKIEALPGRGGKIDEVAKAALIQLPDYPQDPGDDDQDGVIPFEVSAG